MTSAMFMHEWCDLFGMKLNASNSKTMIVSRSCTMYLQLPPLTIGGTVLKESDDYGILGVTFDSRAASQRLGILRESWRVFHMIDYSLGMFSGFCPTCFGALFFSVVLAADTHLNYWTEKSMVPVF